MMKNIFLTISAILILGGILQSCYKKEIQHGGCSASCSDIYFFINKNSQEYNDLLEAFSKKDFTNEPTEERGYNNIYFLINRKKIKVKNKMLLPDNTISHGDDYDNYALFSMYSTKFYTNIFTGKEEQVTFVYDDKSIQLKIKGKLHKKDNAYKPTIEEFYVNDKAHKFYTSEYSGGLFLVE